MSILSIYTVYQNVCPDESTYVRRNIVNILFKILFFIILTSFLCCCCACFGLLEWMKCVWAICCPCAVLPQYHGYTNLNDRMFRFPYGNTTTNINTRISTSAVLGRDNTNYGSTGMSDGRVSPRVQPYYVPGGEAEIAAAMAVPIAEVEMGPMRSPEKDYTPSAPPLR